MEVSSGPQFYGLDLERGQDTLKGVSGHCYKWPARGWRFPSSDLFGLPNLQSRLPQCPPAHLGMGKSENSKKRCFWRSSLATCFLVLPALFCSSSGKANQAKLQTLPRHFREGEHFGVHKLPLIAQ